MTGTVESDPRFPSAAAFLRGIVISLVMLMAIRIVWASLTEAGPMAEVALHPFWFVVILSATQGGLYVGIATAGLATALMGWPDRSMETDLLAHYADVSLTPVLWFLAATVLGSYRRAQIAIENELREQNADLHRDNATLTTEIARLDAAVRSMELSTMTRLSVGDQAIAALSELGRSDARGRSNTVASAARLLTQGPGYVLRRGQPKPHIHWGFPEGYVPCDPGGAEGSGPLNQTVAGHTHAARYVFAGGEIVLLADDARMAQGALTAAAVIAHALEHSLRDERPVARLVQAVG